MTTSRDRSARCTVHGGGCGACHEAYAGPSHGMFTQPPVQGKDNMPVGTKKGREGVYPLHGRSAYCGR